MPSAKGKTSGGKGKKGGAGAKPTGGKSTKSLKRKPQKAAPKKSAAAAKGKGKSPTKPSASKKAAPARKAKPSASPKKGVKTAKKAAPKAALKGKPKAAQKKVVKAKPKAPPKGKAAKATRKAAAKPAPKVTSRTAAAGRKAAAVTKKTVQKVRETAKHPVAVAAVAAAAGAAVTPVARRVAAAVRGHEKAAGENATAEAPKRARRGRSRIHSDEPPTANWFNMTGSKPRPSSFIPAPPRAEAPSATAAPPASSDRILHPEHLASLTLPAIRTFPIRIEIEQATGRTHVMIQPSELTVRVGDGLEWDFRYLGGADTFISEVSIEFSGHLFAQPKFVSKNPGSARPHRLLSGRLPDTAGKGAHNYRIRCKSLVGTEVADALGVINVL